jgi:pimeloyl-ACP methyl ester carboxylesterase
MEAEVEALRADPSPIAKQDVATILAHYERIIRALPQPPIIMGHSFGGAFTQVLIGRGLGAAGVAIDSATVRGVFDLPLSTLKSGLPLLRNPLRRRVAVMLSPAQFHYGFTNTFSPTDARAAYDRYAVPGSRNVLFTGANANLNPGTPLKVPFSRSDRAPLLMIAGGSDHVVPASAVRHNFEKYAKSKAVTEFREFPGRSHFTMIQAGWESIADYALSWATEKASAPAGATSTAPIEPVTALSR